MKEPFDNFVIPPQNFDTRRPVQSRIIVMRKGTSSANVIFHLARIQIFVLIISTVI